MRTHFHSRRSFLAQTIGVSWAGASLMEQSALCAAQARAAAKSGPQPVLFDLERMADGVWAALARPQPLTNCNAVVFENANDVVIVDAHSKPAAVAALTAQVQKEITTKPIRFVINTHFHWDHTQGNPTYRKLAPKADFISSTTTRNLLSELGVARLKASVDEAAASLDRYRRELASATTPRAKAYYQEMISGSLAYIAEMKNYAPELPNITFDHTLVLHDKAHDLHLEFRGRGHTAGDIVIFCPQKKVLATGDLLHSLMPYINDGFPREWPATLRSLAEFGFEKAVGGHGAVQQGREHLDQMAGYITELSERVDEGKRQGRSLRELQASVASATLKSLNGPYRQFLESQAERFNMQAGIHSAAEVITDGLKTNIAEVFRQLERS